MIIFISTDRYLEKFKFGRKLTLTLLVIFNCLRSWYFFPFAPLTSFSRSLDHLFHFIIFYFISPAPSLPMYDPFILTSFFVHFPHLLSSLLSSSPFFSLLCLVCLSHLCYRRVYPHAQRGGVNRLLELYRRADRAIEGQFVVNNPYDIETFFIMDTPIHNKFYQSEQKYFFLNKMKIIRRFYNISALADDYTFIIFYFMLNSSI